MKRKRLSTVEIAAAAGVGLSTLQYWIKTHRIAAPPVSLVNGRAVRLWREAQTQTVRRLKGSLKPGPGTARASKKISART